MRIWDLADPTLFCPSGRDQRGPSGRALSGLSRPQRKGGVDSSSPLDSSLPPQRAYLGDLEALLNGAWSNGGWNKFHLAYRMLIYRGPYPVEWHFIHSGSLDAGLYSCSCQTFQLRRDESTTGMCSIQTVHFRCAPSLSNGLTRTAASSALSVYSNTQAD